MGEEKASHTNTLLHTHFHTHLHLYFHSGHPQYLIFSADLHHQLITLPLLSVKRHTGGEYHSAGRTNDEASSGVQQSVLQRLVEAVADRVDDSHQSDIGYVLLDGGGVDREGEEKAAVYGFSDKHRYRRHAGKTSIPHLKTDKNRWVRVPYLVLSTDGEGVLYMHMTADPEWTNADDIMLDFSVLTKTSKQPWGMELWRPPI